MSENGVLNELEAARHCDGSSVIVRWWLTPQGWQHEATPERPEDGTSIPEEPPVLFDDQHPRLTVPDLLPAFRLSRRVLREAAERDRRAALVSHEVKTRLSLSERSNELEAAAAKLELLSHELGDDQAHIVKSLRDPNHPIRRLQDLVVEAERWRQAIFCCDSSAIEPEVRSRMLLGRESKEANYLECLRAWRDLAEEIKVSAGEGIKVIGAVKSMITFFDRMRADGLQMKADVFVLEVSHEKPSNEKE